MTESKDKLGDRLKAVEQLEAGRRLLPGKPIMARLDGRAFHTFTKGLQRPYDVRLSDLMVGTTQFLVQETHALVGYTQSDEISLCWFEPENGESQYLFDGKIQKLTSVLSSLATTYFTKHLGSIPEKAHLYPTFDCRVWQVIDLHEAYLNFLWRQDDAVKNSISMAAQAVFSHKELHGVNSQGKIQMLEAAGSPWESNPTFFKWGTFVQRVNQMVDLTEEQLEKIPPKHRPAGPVLRSVVTRDTVAKLRNYNAPYEAMCALFGAGNTALSCFMKDAE